MAEKIICGMVLRPLKLEQFARIRYVRVLALHQDLEAQIQALEKESCYKI